MHLFIIIEKNPPAVKILAVEMLLSAPRQRFHPSINSSFQWAVLQ